MVTCPSCGEENPDRARFCLACATPLGLAAQPSTESRRVVTVVFADMAGSTAVGERLDPEALRRVQARYFDTLAAVVERHGGTVEKYIGDAVMAVFGIPRLHEDDALRAVRAADEMRDAVAVLNEGLARDHGVEIAMRIGIQTGEVVADEQGVGQRLVTGDAVNVASRLEQAAAPGEILIGDPTLRLVRDAVEVESIPALDLKGKSAPVAAWRLRTVRPDVAGHERRLDSPMVGRARELELLSRALERASEERTSHLFTLLGTAGVGKSRVVREFLSRAATARVLRGRCLPYGDGITYFALGEMVRTAASLTEADGHSRSLAALRELLTEAADGERIARLVGGMFGWADPTQPDDAGWAFRKLVEHLAHDAPLVLVFDDVQWAEPLLLDVIDHLADGTRDAAILLLCVARPELLETRPGWGGGKLNATSILLEPLPGDEAGVMLDNLLGGATLPTETRDRILAAAEGNPLFVEEMFGMLVDDGVLQRSDGTWRASSDLTQLMVPPTIHLLLAARLDRLDAEERAVMERGSVEGKVFHAGAVTSLSPEPARPTVRARLAALARKELIRPDRAELPGEDAYRFRHLLIRDAAYEALPKEQRATLHEAFARWLEGQAGDRVDDYREILAHHLEEAYRYRSELGPLDDRGRALGRDAGISLRLSAQRAVERGDAPAAARMLRRATSMLEGPAQAEALVELAEALRHQFDFAGAIAVMDEFAGLPDASRSPALRIRAAVHRLTAQASTDPSLPMEQARGNLESLLSDAEAIGDDEAIITCLLEVGLFRFWTGDSAGLRTIGDRLLEQRNLLRPVQLAAAVRSLETDAFWGTTTVAEGFQVLERVRGIVGDRAMDRADCDLLESFLHAMADDPVGFDTAIARADQAWAELRGSERRVFWGQQRAQSLVRLGRVQEAVEQLRLDTAFFAERGETGVNSTSTAMLALFLVGLGQESEAAQLLPRARALAARDDFATRVYIDQAEARVASVAGQHDAALAAVDDAWEHLERTDYLNSKADTLRIRGDVLRAAGRDAEAVVAFDQALAMYDAKGNIADARRLQAHRQR